MLERGDAFSLDGIDVTSLEETGVVVSLLERSGGTHEGFVIFCVDSGAIPVVPCRLDETIVEHTGGEGDLKFSCICAVIGGVLSANF
jgi:hypothetical protein